MNQLVSPLIVLLDEGAPADIGTPFVSCNHRVIQFSDVLSPSAKDSVVAATAIQNNAVLIAVDRDMRQLAKRWGSPGEGSRYSRLNLIFISCNSALAPKRVRYAMSLIEHEWKIACQKVSRAMWITINPHDIRCHR